MATHLSGRPADLIERVRAEVRAALPGGAHVVDAHTHLGVDEDGRALSPAEHIAAMDYAGVDRALVFALNEPDRTPAYRAPNDRVLEWADASEGRLVPFVRLSLDEEPLIEARRCLERGARGIKLHPRAQVFKVDDPRLEAVFELAAEHGLPVLIHAGRGLPEGMAAELARVAERHPEASLILAHAAIVEQGLIAEIASGQPNVYFDTSTWTPLDLQALLGRVSPEQILWASDIPYGQQISSLGLTLGALRSSNLPDDIVRGIMGETAAGLIEGRRPERFSPPMGPPSFELAYDRARLNMYLGSAIPQLWLGQQDVVGFLGLALGACRDANGTLEEAAELIDAAEEVWLAIPTAEDEAHALHLRSAAFLLLSTAQGKAVFG